MDYTKAITLSSSGSLANSVFFPSEFFSGCDAYFVFLIGGEQISGYLEEDVLDFSFAVRQMSDQIFGYNSFYYDRIAKGNILVVGSLAVAFSFKRKIFKKLQIGRAHV